MKIEELKKLDKRVREIPYPFGENYPLFQRVFVEAAQSYGLPVSEVIKQYTGWKYSKK